MTDKKNIQIEVITSKEEKLFFMDVLADEYLKFIRSNGGELLYNFSKRTLWLYNPNNNQWGERTTDRKQNGVPMVAELFNFLRLKGLFENRFTNSARINQEITKIISILISENKLTPTLAPDRYHNVLNGIIDTKKKVLIKHSSKKFTDYQYPFEVDMEKEFGLNNYPLFKKLLVGGLSYDGKNIDKELELMMSQVFATAISPKKYPVMFLLTGPSGTSKSTFMDLLTEFIGKKRTSKSPLEKLAGVSDNKFSVFKAVVGKKICISEEVSDAKIEGNNLKTLISENYREVEAKGVDSFDVEYNTRFYGTSNNVLSFDGVAGIDRRLKYISLSRVIPSSEIDIDIVKKISRDKKEMEGVFLFALEGLKSIEEHKGKDTPNWKDGIYQSDISLEEKKEVEEKSRPLNAFLKIVELKEDKNSDVNSKTLREVYKTWANEEGHTGSSKITQAVFGKQFAEYLMSEFGYTKNKIQKIKNRKENNTVTIYKGVTLNMDVINEITNGFNVGQIVSTKNDLEDVW